MTVDQEPSEHTESSSATELSVEELEKALGYRFQDRDLLWRALTHRSFSYERGGLANYERLEFLGDSVLGLLTARWLFDRFPERSEGELSKLKSFLVSAPVLASYGKSIDLGSRIRLGVGEDRSGGRAKSSILADTVEALFGAMYLEGGLEVVKPLVESILERAMKIQAEVAHTDAKTHLQEVSQAKGWGLPVYEVIAESGPDHLKIFTLQCAIGSRLVVTASGRSKKAAAQRAAAEALESLEAEGLAANDAT